MISSGDGSSSINQFNPCHSFGPDSIPGFSFPSVFVIVFFVHKMYLNDTINPEELCIFLIP